jgi:hypothetical protein
VTLSSVYASKAKALNIDTTRAAKLVRSRMRSNFAAMVKADARIGKAKKAANDGNRWPKAINRKAAAIALGKSTGDGDA